VWAQLLALLGLLVISISVLLFDNRVIPPFPNCYTLLPTCGTALILIFGNCDTLVGRLLCTRPLRWMGLISYSAYLWHQPLVVFLRLRSMKMQSVPYTSFIFVAVVVLAILSYIFVEQPFRNRTFFSRKQIFFMSGMGAVFMFAVALFVIHTANVRSLAVRKMVKNPSMTMINALTNKSLTTSQTTSNQSLAMSEVINNQSLTMNEVVNNHSMTVIEKYPTFSNESAATNKRIILIGDSFAQDFINMAIETNSLSDYEIRCYYVRYYCQIYMGSEDRLQWIAPGHRELCIDVNDIQSARPLIRQANIIILAGCWLEWSAKRLPKTLELLDLRQTQKLFVLGLKNFGKVNLTQYMTTSYEYRTSQLQPPEEDFVNVNSIMKRTLNESIFIDVMSMTCNRENGTCPVFTPDGKLISYDGWHTTKHGATFVGGIIFKKFPLNQL
jgi:hypothetical protein